MIVAIIVIIVFIVFILLILVVIVAIVVAIIAVVVVYVVVVSYNYYYYDYYYDYYYYYYYYIPFSRSLQPIISKFNINFTSFTSSEFCLLPKYPISSPENKTKSIIVLLFLFASNGREENNVA
jgi:hypothetical protein